MVNYNRMVQRRNFLKGELVLKAMDMVTWKTHTSKWALNWEGLYVMQNSFSNYYCILLT